MHALNEVTARGRYLLAMENQNKNNWWDILIDGQLFVSVKGLHNAKAFLANISDGDTTGKYVLAPTKIKKLSLWNSSNRYDERIEDIAPVAPNFKHKHM